MAPLGYYFILSALLFTIGAVGFLIRKNPLIMFMSIELMLNAANLSFASFARHRNILSGQVIAFFVIAVAAAAARRRAGGAEARRGSSKPAARSHPCVEKPPRR